MYYNNSNFFPDDALTEQNEEYSHLQLPESQGATNNEFFYGIGICSSHQEL